MSPFRQLVIFALMLLLLRRVFGIQISIVGSIVLTVLLSLLFARFRSKEDG